MKLLTQLRRMFKKEIRQVPKETLLFDSAIELQHAIQLAHTAGQTRREHELQVEYYLLTNSSFTPKGD